METVRKRYDEMLSVAIAPPLRTRGFRKTRNTFHRASGGNAQIVEFQASQFGSRDQVSFTINVGLVFAALSSTAARETQRRPTIGQAVVRERVGTLMSKQRDHWWEITDVTDIDQLAAELITLLDATVVPWLDARENLDRVVAGLRADPEFLLPWTTASLAVKLERSGRANLARELANLPPVQRWRQARRP